MVGIMGKIRRMLKIRRIARRIIALKYGKSWGKMFVQHMVDQLRADRATSMQPLSLAQQQDQREVLDFLNKKLLEIDSALDVEFLP